MRYYIYTIYNIYILYIIELQWVLTRQVPGAGILKVAAGHVARNLLRVGAYLQSEGGLSIAGMYIHVNRRHVYAKQAASTRTFGWPSDRSSCIRKQYFGTFC